MDTFFNTFSFPEQACEELKKAYNRIYFEEYLKAEFEQLLESYEADMNCHFPTLLAGMRKLSSQAGIHEYTGNLLLFVCMAPILKQHYLKAGVKEEIWFVSMCDLKWKMDECKEVHNIWGTFVPEWFELFFQMQRFGFGKLQFELKAFGIEYQKDGISLSPGSMVVNVHIPRTGTKLDRDSMLKSYEMAYEFFKDMTGTGQVVFVCHSWLLFPRNKEVLSEKSNLYAFISDFDIFQQGEYADYKEVWRVFDTVFDGEVAHLPQNTSLRRAYADWIRKGEKTGWGYGLFEYRRK